MVGSRWKGTPTTLVIDIIIETMETGGIHMWPVSTWEVLPSFCTEFFFQTEHSVWLLLCFFFFVLFWLLLFLFFQFVFCCCFFCRFERSPWLRQRKWHLFSFFLFLFSSLSFVVVFFCRFERSPWLRQRKWHLMANETQRATVFGLLLKAFRSFDEIYRVLSVVTGFYRVLPSLALGFTGFYRV